MAAAVEQQFEALETKLRQVEEQLPGATGDEKVALQQRLAALEQRLAALQQHQAALEQQKLLLMQLQSAPATAKVEQQLQQVLQRLDAQKQDKEELLQRLDAQKQDKEELLQRLDAQKQDKEELFQRLDAQKLDKEELLLRLDAQKQDKEELLQLLQQQAAEVDMMSKLMKLVVTQQLKPTSSSLKSEQYRTPAIAAYNVAREVDGVQQLLCMVSDRYFPDSEVTAGHILRVEWAPMARYFGVSVHSPSNIIFMHKKIEKAFDRQEWCLLTQPDGTLQIEVLNSSMLQPRGGDILCPPRVKAEAKQTASMSTIMGEPRDVACVRGSNDRLCWSHVHGKPLVLPPGSSAAPYKRCAALHAWAAVQMAECRGWKKKGEVQLPDEGWQSPGVDQELMARLLRDAEGLAADNDYSEGSGSEVLAVTPEESFTDE